MAALIGCSCVEADQIGARPIVVTPNLRRHRPAPATDLPTASVQAR
jgi:hypothetical protein